MKIATTYTNERATRLTIAHISLLTPSSVNKFDSPKFQLSGRLDGKLCFSELPATWHVACNLWDIGSQLS